MKSATLIWFVVALALPLHAQFQEMTLPEASLINGISFYSATDGLITTEDSIAYWISFKENQTPQIRELEINDRYFLHFKYSNPFWVNDSTFGLVRTWWDDWACGGHRILMTHDSGRTFRLVYNTIDIYNIYKILVPSDSVLLFSITSDIVNSFDLVRCVHDPRNNHYKHYDLIGDFTPEFEVVDDEKILISGIADSVFYYFPERDSLVVRKTNLEDLVEYDYFRHLQKGDGGELLAARANGVFRSTDDGINWHLVLPGENRWRIEPEGNGRWWAMAHGDDENRIWQSLDFGVTWKFLFAVDKFWILREVAYPNWFWLTNYNIPGKILYGQYDPSAISVNQITPVRVFRLFPAYPNPFNSTTTVAYELKRPGLVEIGIYNIRGQLVRQIIRENQAEGRYQVQWNAVDALDLPVTSGLYLVRLVYENSHRMTHKILLLK